jgi:hypothetical protein
MLLLLLLLLLLAQIPETEGCWNCRQLRAT